MPGLVLMFSGVVQAETLCGGRTVRLINPFPPGGPSDLLARGYADTLQAGLRQAVVVENRAGAGGNVGAELVAHAAPDGCTVLMGIDTTVTINPALYTTMPFRIEELRPVMIVASSGLLVGVHPATGVRTFGDLLARGRQSGLAFSSGGNGSPGHLAVSMLSEGADLRSTHVPYRGNTPAVTAVVAGEVDGGILATPGLLPFVRSGRVVALAVTGTRRSALLPGVPTAIESGVPGLVLEVLYVAMVPFATPPAIVDVLRTRLVESLAPADVRARLTQLDLTLEAQADPEASLRLDRQRERYRDLVRRTGMKAD